VRVFTAGKGTVEIVGTWGRVAIPADIKDVCMELVMRGFRERGAGGQEQPIDGMTLDATPRGLSARALAILKAHGYQQAVFVS
jgi:hypothetical protein